VLDATGLSAVEQSGRIHKLLNDRLRAIVLQHSLLQATFTKVLTPGDGVYSLSADLGVSDFAALKTLRYNASGVQEGRFLDQVSAAEIDMFNAYQAVPNNVAVYALAGLDTLMLYPTPVDAGTLTGRYVQRPAQMATDSDVPAVLPEEFHDLLWLAVARQASRLTEKSRAQMALWEPAYQSAERDFRIWLAQQPGAIPPKATARTRASYIRPHDRSTYPGSPL
jgi:hypothetical protein